MEKVINQPIISVIVPLYNKQKCINQTIDSVLSQSFSDFELLIIDDGSTDDSLLVVERIKDARIRIIRQKNGGVSCARNKGISEAKCEWLFFLDADDLIYPNTLELFYNNINSNSHVNLVIANFNAVENGIKGLQCKYTINGLLDIALKLFWEKMIYIRTGSFIVKKIIVIENDCFNEELSLYEDLDLLLKLMETEGIIYSNEVVLDYIRDNSYLSSVRNNIKKDFSSTIEIENEKGFKKKILCDFYLRSILKYILKGRFINAIFLIKRNYKNIFYLILYFILRLKY